MHTVYSPVIMANVSSDILILYGMQAASVNVIDHLVIFSAGWCLPKRRELYVFVIKRKKIVLNISLLFPLVAHTFLHLLARVYCSYNYQNYVKIDHFSFNS